MKTQDKPKENTTVLEIGKEIQYGRKCKRTHSEVGNTTHISNKNNS